MQDRGVAFSQFTGGLNNVADESAIADTELTQVINFELDSNGSLVARPPITKYDDFPTAASVGEFLGYYNRSDGTSFLVIANNSKTYIYNPITLTWTEIASFAASGCAQYQNRLYICARATRGGWWGEVTPGTGVYTYQSLSGGAVPMPFGDQIALYKDRLFIAGWGSSDARTTVYMSEVTTTVGTDINNWPVNNFFYVGRGDGQWITKLYPGPDVLNIFRNGSTYYFSYDSDPALGQLRAYQGGVGAENKYSVAVFENAVLTLSKGGLYQLLGWQFQRLNDPSKLAFYTRTTVTPYTISAALSVLGSRALVWYSGETYAFDLNTRVWTQWDSPTTQLAYMVAAPRPEGYFGADVAYGLTGSGSTSKFGVYRVKDEINSTDTEDMDCTIRTKAHDYSTPEKYKTLYWWTADVLTSQPVTGTAVPIVLAGAAVSWDDMSATTWDLLTLGTWDNPLVKSPEVSYTRTIPSSSPYRVSVKFGKKMHFRRIYYEVALSFDGTLSTGPARIFGLVTYVDVGEKISKGVT